MPTCSQAKIITNLESSDLNRGLFRLVGEDLTTALAAATAARGGGVGVGVGGNVDDETSQSSSQSASQHQHQPPQELLISQELNHQRRVKKKHDCVGGLRRTAANDERDEDTTQHNQNLVAATSSSSSSQTTAKAAAPTVAHVRFANTINSHRRISIDDLPQQQQHNQRETNYKLLKLHKVPIVFGEMATPNRRFAFNYLSNQLPTLSNMRSSRNNGRNLNMRSSENHQRFVGIVGAKHAWTMACDGDEEEDYEDRRRQRPAQISPTSLSPSSSSSSSRMSCSVDVNRSSNSSTDNNNAVPVVKLNRKSIDYSLCLPINSKRNSIDIETKELLNVNGDTTTDRRNSLTGLGNLGSSRMVSLNFPKLALDVDALNTMNNMVKAALNNATATTTSNGEYMNEFGVAAPNNGLISARKIISLEQAKRLLALASIRPSKTFHKTMTDEEIEVLKKYYELMKPKASSSSAAQAAAEAADRARYQNCPPVVYNTAKVNSQTLVNLRNVLEHYRKEIASGEYALEFDQSSSSDDTGCSSSTSSSSSSGRFVLTKKSSSTPEFRFPEDLNDALVAFAINTCWHQQQQQQHQQQQQQRSSSSSESRTLGEANLFRIVHWNDTMATATTSTPTAATTAAAKKMTTVGSAPPSLASKILATTSSVPSPSSSTISFEYIRNLSSLISSIIEPKIVKQLAYTGVDVGALPGSVNFDMPSFEELGINLESLISKYSNSNATSGVANLNGDANNNNGSQETEFQSAKLKTSAYKKLREKVAKSRVMWFSAPPQRRPLSVIFELAGDTDIGHQAVLDEANAYLKETTTGRVDSVEFVPRSVLLGSVYVDNMWILTVSDAATKYKAINNGICIRGRKCVVRSYDDFIFDEYQKFVKTEKYKQLIRNHEKAVQIQTARRAKK